MVAANVKQHKNCGTKRKSLLFIDDDPSVISSLRLLFESDYQTFSASSVAEGVRLFSEIHPEIVVLDLRLPDKNGIEALRQIRKLDPSAAVLILTGYSTLATAEESLRLGAVDYLHKPFDVKYLKNRIQEIALNTGSNRDRDRGKHALTESLQDLREFEALQNASAAFLHDISSPLTALLTASDLLNQMAKEHEDSPGSKMARVASMVSDNAQYITALVEQWRAFAEPQTFMQDKFRTRQAIELSVNLIRERANDHGVTLQLHTQSPDTTIHGNHFAIARVLANLLKNAIEAVPAGSGLILLTAQTRGNRFYFTVSDNGKGILPHHLDLIFQPRFTTKAKGMGLGMGLYISKKIIEASGGEISVRSPGSMSGAEFIISLPLS
ncbi:MAG: hybrid sensor histidine kinase/response regulator [Methylacidiphilales bacterium]|nr:hybrid sensor histidine kinase/response regulator [Candidatus Methylacidiphilales bacterium]